MIDEPEPPFGRRSRLEDEVLEILHRSDRPPTFPERMRATTRRTVQGLRVRRFSIWRDIASQFDSGSWLIVAVGLGIVAFLVRDASPLLARTLALLSLGLIVLAIVRSFARPQRGTVKRWRGRDIHISPTTRPLWIDRVFRSQRRPPRR